LLILTRLKQPVLLDELISPGWKLSLAIHQKTNELTLGENWSQAHRVGPIRVPLEFLLGVAIEQVVHHMGAV